jgi:hypothetical protein
MKYPSNITFLYYNDLEGGCSFMSDVLELPIVMDQGFARIYQSSPSSYLGVVQKKEASPYQGDTLVSLNTRDVESEYNRVSKMNVIDITQIIDFPSIPLRSFFFKDEEGHRFEIQEFQTEEDRNRFL